MSNTDNFTGTVAEQIEAILTTTPQPAEAFAEVLGRKVSSVKGVLSKLVEADKAIAVEVDDQPTTFRLPKRIRANYGYERDTSQGQNATKRSQSLHSVLEAAESGLNLEQLAEAIGQLEGRTVTKRAVTHVVWRHRVERHQADQDVPWPFVKMDGKGAKATYVLDAEYEAANTQPADEANDAESNDEAAA